MKLLPPHTTHHTHTHTHTHTPVIDFIGVILFFWSLDANTKVTLIKVSDGAPGGEEDEEDEGRGWAGRMGGEDGRGGALSPASPREV